MEKTELSSEKVTIGFNGEGGLVRLVDREIARDYISPQDIDRRPLFRLVCVEADDDKFLPWEIKLTSLQAEEKEVNVSDCELRFTFKRIDGKPIDVDCLVRLDKDSAFSIWRIHVRNRSYYAIRAIEYPVLPTTLQLGESAEDDRILIPHADGFLAVSPLVKEWMGEFGGEWGVGIGSKRNSQRFYYPSRCWHAGLSAQVVAYYDPDGGLYIATHDGEGHIKQLGPERAGDAIEFTPIHHMPEAVGNDYESPYDTVVGCFQGDWQTVADIYKRWARKQPWCAKRIADREDIPDWIKKGAFFFSFKIRGQEAGENYLDKVPDYMEKWQKEFGIPTVAMMAGWEKIVEWTGPDYSPPYGGTERFKKMCSELRKRGIYVFAFALSGLKWILRKKYRRTDTDIDYNDLEDFRREGERYAATKPDGSLLISYEDFDKVFWGAHAHACVATPLAHSMLYDSSMKLIDLGVQVSEADQLNCGAVPPCYNTKHGHPAGRGKWQIDSLRRIYSEVRRDGKAKDPEFVWAQEAPGEMYIQELDCYLGRNYIQPRAREKGLVEVPLFSYLYHEYLPCWGGDWTPLGKENPAGVYYQAVHFVNGNLPAGSPGLSPRYNYGPEEADPKTMRMLRNVALCLKAFPEFLILGEMLNTPSLQVPAISVTFSQRGIVGKTINFPSVLHRAWRSPEGLIAYTLANISDEEQRFPLKVLHYGVESPVDLLLHKNGGKGEIVATGVKLPYIVDLALSPQDATMLRVIQTRK